jgi:hypothetical protein
MKHSALATYFSLAYPPISNYDFSFIREEKVVQEYLKKSQLYMISQRPKLVFDNVFIDTDQNIHFEIRQETTEYKVYGILPVRQSAFLTNLDDDIYVEFGSHNKEYTFDKPPFNNLDGFKFYNKDEVFIAWLTPEKLIYEYSHNTIEVAGLDGWGELFKYKILYVGKATDQDIWQRLTGHETLQDIISKEFPLQYGSLPTHEITLLLFKINAFENFEVLGNFQEMQNMDKILDTKSLENLFVLKAPPEEKNIFLDAEKAFVKLLNPEYNSVKFKSYPKSKDGLYKEKFDVFSYKLRDNIVLICNDTEIFGSTDDNESDTIQIIDNKEVKVIKPSRRK